MNIIIITDSVCNPEYKEINLFFISLLLRILEIIRDNLTKKFLNTERTGLLKVHVKSGHKFDMLLLVFLFLFFLIR